MSETNTDEKNGGIIRKITVKEIGGKPTLEKIVEKKNYPIMHVWGRANRVKTGSSDFGEFVKLLGMFEAVNLETGVVSRAPVCILPEPANGMIAAQLQGDEPAAEVAFALEIGVKRDESSSVGYKYWTRELVKASDADPLADLRSKVKALEAPKTDAAESEAEKEPAKPPKKK